MAGGSWTVMTKNLYLGADIGGPLRATSGRVGPDAVEALLAATGHVYAELVATDFAVRSRLVAAEIAAAGPDLVGLQEVALWRRGPVDLEQLGRPDATEILWDFLALLRQALTEAGSPYDVAAVFTGADVEAPAMDLQDPAGEAFDLRVTLHDVVLVRSDAGLRVCTTGAAGFDHRLTVEVAGITVTFAHGFAWAEVDDESGAGIRFVTTHLDSESSAVALAQAGEVAAATRSGDRPVVLVGDFNSDPAARAVRRADGVPECAAYRWLVDDAGFVDAALAAGAATPTWGFGTALSDDDTSGLRHRIDFAFVEPSAGLAVEAAWTTGTAATDRDPVSGLWPSDHAGLVARLRGRPSEARVRR